MNDSGRVIIFTKIEYTEQVHIKVLSAAVRDDLRDFGVYSFHAVFVEMGG
ncbi:MAG: hypothetical protein Fur0041_06990 [Bacteroidia bacterium]